MKKSSLSQKLAIFRALGCFELEQLSSFSASMKRGNGGNLFALYSFDTSVLFLLLQNKMATATDMVKLTSFGKAALEEIFMLLSSPNPQETHRVYLAFGSFTRREFLEFENMTYFSTHPSLRTSWDCLGAKCLGVMLREGFCSANEEGVHLTDRGRLAAKIARDIVSVVSEEKLYEPIVRCSCVDCV